MGLLRGVLVVSVSLCVAGAAGGEVTVANGDVLQAVIDANPGRMICLPGGDYIVHETVRISTDNTGIHGYGRIVQENPEAHVLEIEHATGVRIEGITLTRAEGKEDATGHGVLCNDVRRLTLRNVRVVDCRSRSGAIAFQDATNCTIEQCEVLNYKRIAVDDRTDNPEHWGYAFHAIDGTGIEVKSSTGTVIRDNRVLEENLLPTREVKERYHLGTLTEGAHPSVQGKFAASAFANGYVSNWHQGSAVLVSGSDVHHTIISGNYIQNSAQGIDLHSDNVVVTGNVVDHGMMGIKGTHGCRNLIIANNMLTHIDMWGILLNPGAASHYAEDAAEDRPAQGQNVDGGTIIANNVITDYGYGHELWNYGGGSYAMAFIEGQLETNPPLTDVIVQGNMVYNTGKDGHLEDGKVIKEPPRYRYAVYVGPWGEGTEPGPTFPQHLHFIDNVFHPGTEGVSNVPLDGLR